MASRTSKRALRIRTETPLLALLTHYGYRVHPDGGGREQQFPCDLHGDGKDGKPSARLYPQNQSFYCFGCGVSRNAINLVREKEGFSFHSALEFVERFFRLPPLPFEDDDSSDEIHAPPDAGPDLDAEAFKQRLLQTESILKGITSAREVPCAKAVAMWEAFDRITFLLESQGSSGLGVLLDKLHTRIIGGASEV